MIHHGLEKLQDPQGFAEFVVGKYFPFLPGDPVIWTFGAAKIALEAAGRLCTDAVLASDGFFPFADTVKLANEYGIKAIIQPGGSLRDQESIDMCNSKGISMLFTQKRHFLH